MTTIKRAYLKGYRQLRLSHWGEDCFVQLAKVVAGKKITICCWPNPAAERALRSEKRDLSELRRQSIWMATQYDLLRLREALGYLRRA